MIDEEIKAAFAPEVRRVLYCFQCDKCYPNISEHDYPDYLKEIQGESRTNIANALSSHFCVYSFEEYTEAISNAALERLQGKNEIWTQAIQLRNQDVYI